MRIESEIKLDYSDVLLRPKRSELTSRKDVDLERTFHLKWGSVWRGVPIVAANMDATGTPKMAKVLSSERMLTCLSKHVSPDHITDYGGDSPCTYVAMSFGMTVGDKYALGLIGGPPNDLEGLVSENDVAKRNMLNALSSKHYSSSTQISPIICLDVANGYMERFVEYVEQVRTLHPDKIIIAGNVVTAEMTESLILAGVDIVKVGIGPGSVCTTRKVTGVGYPQLSAVIECADAAHGIGGHIMADGGCVCPGDVAKAFAAGADFVMLGGMLAGHDESAGDIVYDEHGTPTHKEFYGMSSATAMHRHAGGVANYRASEGKTVRVPYRGPVIETIQEILGGVRSACTYIGADQIKSMPKCATFIRVNRQLNNIFS